MTSRTPPLRILLPLCACLLAGCFSLSGRVERSIERELPEAIGPADRYEVDVEGLRARAGEARRVSVVGTRVRPDAAPTLDVLDLELHGVHYDRREGRLERVDSARGIAWIVPDDLALFLEAQENVRTASVELRPPDEATIRLQPALAGITLPPGAVVELMGRLVAEDGDVSFVVSEVRVGGAGLGGAVARRLSDLINPLVDLSDALARLRVTDVRVEDGLLRVEATGDPAGMRFQ